MNLNKYIDQTLLRPDANKHDIRQLCAEALEHNFAAVCISPIWVSLATDLLAGSDVATCTVIGFPTGAHLPRVKLAEAHLALADKAQELDTVINIAAVQARDKSMLRADIEPLAQAAHANGAILKVILETALLSDDDILFASSCCWEFGADFIKTSTGMLKGENSGASIHAVHLMEASRREIESASRDNRSEIRTRGIKASGGIRDRATALAMIEAGATRIGTSSGAAIVGNKISDSINTY